MKGRWTILLLAVLAFASPALAGPFFVGASIGNATLEADTPDINFDGSDTSFKAYGGYRFLRFFGIEGGYADLGAPEDAGVKIEATGWDAFAVGVLPLGPIELFAKVGVVSWDLESNGPGSVSDGGEDAAYGVGLAFSLKKIAIRAEFEKFDVGAVDNLYLASVGVEWRF